MDWKEFFKGRDKIITFFSLLIAAGILLFIGAPGFGGTYPLWKALLNSIALVINPLAIVLVPLAEILWVPVLFAIYLITLYLMTCLYVYLFKEKKIIFFVLVIVLLLGPTFKFVSDYNTYMSWGPVPPPDIPASAEEPIVLPSDEITVKHGKETAFDVNYYNDYQSGMVEPALKCTGILADSIATENMGGIVTASHKAVDEGTYQPFKFTIPAKATSTENVGTDVCEIKFCVGEFVNGACSGNMEMKQIVITVI